MPVLTRFPMLWSFVKNLWTTMTIYARASAFYLVFHVSLSAGPLRLATALVEAAQLGPPADDCDFC